MTAISCDELCKSCVAFTPICALNATLFYERLHVFDVRLGAEFISRSLFTANPGSAALDVYSENRTSVDSGSRYFVTNEVKFCLDAKNLTNTPLTNTEGTSDRPFQRETYRTTVLFGFEASL
jgi:hypothetical protein